MRLSVLIPALDEAAALPDTIAAATSALGPCQLVVVDACSSDSTVEVAAACGAHVMTHPGPRGAALNAAAAVASGDVLLFLHADTLLPTGAGAAMQGALRAADGGAFRIRFDQRKPLLEVLVNLRSRLFTTVYGDQAIFVRRSAFERLGGFVPVPLWDDYDLVKRLRKNGGFRLLELPVTTSARRHRGAGTVRTLLRIWWLQLLYRLGVPPERLARDYPPSR